MSMRTTNMLVGNGDLDQTGLATRADGYYGYADGLQTVAFYLRLFEGRVFIEATVADNPTDDDWFPIALGPVLDHVDFEEPTTKIETFNVIGNFVFLRARIERAFLGKAVSELGRVERVVLSL
jgi:hypothetical protein